MTASSTAYGRSFSPGKHSHTATTTLNYGPRYRARTEKCPPEILSQIFLHVEDPQLVSHVCRHWRQVALYTGVLWANVDWRGKRDEKALAWLGRSRNTPLHLKMDLGKSRGKDSAVQLADLVDIRSTLLHVHGRLRTFWLRAAAKDVLEAVINTFQHTIPPLYDLSLHLDDIVHQPVELPSAHIPKLHTLSLTGITPTWSSDAPPRLTSLMLSFILYPAISFSDIMRTLNDVAPTLQQLSILSCNLEPFESVIQPFNFPQLHDLHLEQLPNDKVLRLFGEAMTMPRLRRLRINCRNPIRVMEAFRSVSLQNLDLISFSPHISRSLGYFPNLRTLRLSADIKSTDTALLAMTVPSNSQGAAGILVPLLQILFLPHPNYPVSHSRPGIDYIGTIKNLVRSRLGRESDGIMPLREIWLSQRGTNRWDKELYPDLVVWLKERVPHVEVLETGT